MRGVLRSCRWKGFSLIETLLAVTILTTGLTAALGLLSFTLRTVRVSTNATVAAHLAAEGVEIIRNLRDNNWLRRDIERVSRGWREGLENGSYQVQFDSAYPLTSYDPGAFLQRDTDGRYCYGCGSDTIFKRRVELTGIDIPRPPDPAIERVRVKVTVSWQDVFKAREVVVEDVLYDWK